jgi:hypothetical protein
VWLKWQSACFANTKPSVQTPVLQKKKRERKGKKKERRKEGKEGKEGRWMM